MKGRLVVLTLILFTLTSGLLAPVAVAQEDPSGKPADEPVNGDETGEEAAVNETQTRVVDVSSILTVTELEWREDNSVAISVDADRQHTVTYVVQEGDRRFRLDTVTVPVGESTIVVDSVDTKLALVSQSQGYEFRNPGISLLDLPPSEWMLTYTTFFGAIFGAILGVAYKYKKTVYEAEDTIRSIFDIKWW